MIYLNILLVLYFSCFILYFDFLGDWSCKIVGCVSGSCDC